MEDDDQADPWTLRIIRILDDAAENKADVWVSVDGTVGFTGVPKKLEDFIYTITRHDGAFWTMCVFDMKVIFENAGGKTKTKMSSPTPVGFRN